MEDNANLQDNDVEIMPTDIVFDCEHCGHNLVVDYRAAGLQVPCPSCGAIIQAPIPEGMHIEDLDCDPGEILQQLLQTRRMLVKAEAVAQKAGDKVLELSAQLNEYRARFRSIRDRLETLSDAVRIADETRRGVLDLLSDKTVPTPTVTLDDAGLEPLDK